MKTTVQAEPVLVSSANGGDSQMRRTLLVTSLIAVTLTSAVYAGPQQNKRDPYATGSTRPSPQMSCRDQALADMGYSKDATRVPPNFQHVVSDCERKRRGA